MSLSVRFATTPADFDAWNRFVLAAPSTSFYAVTHWLNSYTDFGARTRYLLAESGGQIVGGAALLVFRAGPLAWVQVPHGPVFSAADPAIIQAVLDALEDYARSIHAMFLEITPFELSASPDVALRAQQVQLDYRPDLLQEANLGLSIALQKRGFTPGRPLGLFKTVREGQIVDLRVDDLLASFRKGTRRDVRYSLDSELTLKLADTPELLRAGYDLIAENAARQNYEVRPWDTFQRSVWPGIQSGTSLLLLAEYQSNLLAAVLVLLGGARGAYVMGGTRRTDLDRIFPAHFLHYQAMQELLKRGYGQYDLTSVGPPGVADFKRGFRPDYYQLVDIHAKVYRPLRLKLFQKSYPYLYRHRRQIARLVFRAKSLLGRA